jgi:hypothetical protein
MTTEIVLAAAALAFLCALALLWSRWPLWSKALLVLGTTAFFFHADEVVHRIWGLPAADALPARFVLLAAVFEEPSAKSKGALYVWVNPLENGKPAKEPRAYRLPYAKDLHALLDDGMKKVRQGVSQMGSAEPKSGPKGFSWLRPGGDEQVVKIRDLPAPQLPEK